MKKAIIISGLIVSLFTSVSCSMDSTEAVTPPAESVALLKNSKTIEIEILELINNLRISKGLPSLRLNDQIRTQTNNHTNYMIKNQLASHDNFFERKNYLSTHANAKYVSENVATGYSNAQSVVNAWLDSDSHRLNIESDHTHFNITAEQDSNDKWYFTNIFMNTNN